MIGGGNILAIIHATITVVDIYYSKTKQNKKNLNGHEKQFTEYRICNTLTW